MTDLATRITHSMSGVLERRIGRRSFMTRAAVAGSAMTVSPLGYVLRPVSAYAAICGCANQQCDCGQKCCDGYTEFCCTLTGENACPPGSIVAGWWKADGSGLCVANGADQPRYYMDCNAPAAGGCGPNGVTPATGMCSCGCANGSCDNRVQCCTAFRYGQCNQHVPCVGPIVCRVVTCSPPWTIEPSCTTTTATDNFTRTHDAPCLHAAPVSGSLPVVVNQGRWYRGFDRVNHPDAAQPPFEYGNPGDFALMGDWTGAGVQTPGIFRSGWWLLRTSNTSGGAQGVFLFGDPGMWPVVGDWVGDGISRPGVYKNGVWHLRLSHTSGIADISFVFGDPGDYPLVGDWTGDGVMTPAVVRGNQWFLRHSLSTGYADETFTFGQPGDIPIAGDWNGDGVWSPGVIRGGNRWLLRHDHSDGRPDAEIIFDLAGVDLARDNTTGFRTWSQVKRRRAGSSSR
jgi:hypothetical protein